MPQVVHDQYYLRYSDVPSIWARTFLGSSKYDARCVAAIMGMHATHAFVTSGASDVRTSSCRGRLGAKVKHKGAVHSGS